MHLCRTPTSDSTTLEATQRVVTLRLESDEGKDNVMGIWESRKSNNTVSVIHLLGVGCVVVQGPFLFPFPFLFVSKVL